MFRQLSSLIAIAGSAAVMAQENAVTNAGPAAAQHGATAAARIEAGEAVAVDSVAADAIEWMPGERFADYIPADWEPLPATREPDAAPDALYGVVGYVEPAPEGLLDHLEWRLTDDEGAQVAAIEFSSAGAHALRVRFDEDFGRDGVELRVYDPVSGAAFGPYTRPIRDENGHWWTTPIFGEHIGLEFVAPATVEAPLLPKIGAIAYINGDSPFTERGCAHNDVTCVSSWANEAQAVVELWFIDGNGNVAGTCSGALLNRTPSDLCPLVMTANHCIGNQSAANSTAFIWQFQTPNCNGMPPNANTLPRSDGSLLLKRYTASDWNLVGLYEAPGANFFLGWSSGSWSDGAATGIHHPGGTFKRISFGSKVDNHEQEFCDASNNCFTAEVWDVEYTSGYTQPGSSGSPVMDSSRRVRGTLSGGPADCMTSRYGRFDLAFTNLQYYLSSIASPVVVTSWAGDPGNNGSLERGTASNPFSTVFEGSFAVVAGGNVEINPGSYNERFTIRRPMTLKRRGTSGIVRIGQ
ncbi:MAG: hypothetical protein KDA32_03975 [Phycisphaerales bacterium]|nr:hypothetical protein [Phycisphaerales bacterium]